MEQIQCAKQMVDILKRSFAAFSNTLGVRKGEQNNNGTAPKVYESPDELGYGIWQ